MNHPQIICVGNVNPSGHGMNGNVFYYDGLSPTLTTNKGEGIKLLVDWGGRWRVRRMTPTECGRVQAFNMDRWEQVVSNGQAYKQFGNAVTVTLFWEIAKKIRKAIEKAHRKELNTMQQRTLKVNDFFCGCGGLGQAFKNAGFEIVGAWDFDKYAVQSYKRNIGDHVTQADIKELTYKDIPKADVWTFGFPCQDLSVAGKQRGLVLKCQDCETEIEINPEEYTGEIVCPNCGGSNTKSESRSGCFFEIMRLLDETAEHNPEAMPAVILAENVRAVKPYLPVLEVEYKKRGYTAHAEMFNSKFWGVPQNRERYAIVGTRDVLNLSFVFPTEQHEFVPKLSDFLEDNVDEKYYLPDEKAKTIISQALEKLEELGKCHACITPDRINKRQNGPRAKAEDEPMFTLTAQDLHGVIVLEEGVTEEDLTAAICEETGLLDPNGCGKTLRVGGGTP